MNESILAELSKTADDLNTKLSAFSEQEFNTFPGPEKWSAGQMTQHVLKSVTSFDELLSSPGKKAERAADEKVQELKSVFLNFETKLKSPDFILPDQTVFVKEQILTTLNKQFEKIEEIVKNADLTEIAAFQMPVLGEMTKLEMLTFVIVHTRRHVHQAGRIFDEVQNLN